ncbi:MAG: tRNA (adenosine(37)-N6)-dimethylallyltransferase MiaA [Kiritimatiellaeota bacterium]|nr:tRNA (adenosine(37)-N6)-dimethylallyltransferase MiaA [Kiritimatiellota bacterium]
MPTPRQEPIDARPDRLPSSALETTQPNVRTSPAYILAGATATGKSRVAQALAEQTGCAILSADAMLVYKGMDIGTAKPTPAERGSVPYHGIDLVTPAEPFSTGRWLAAACGASELGMRNLESGTGDAPRLIVAGGTGLYIKALTDGIGGAGADPEARAAWQRVFEQGGLRALQDALRQKSPAAFAAIPDPSNPRRLIRALEHLAASGALPQHWKRPPPNSQLRTPNSQLRTPNSELHTPPIVVLTMPREQLHRRILRRAETMFASGLAEEVRALREAYPEWSATAAKAIGYAETAAMLDGALTREQAVERTATRTRQLAKRQETWFRHQANAAWLNVTENETTEDTARRVLQLWRQHGPTAIRQPPG